MADKRPVMVCGLGRFGSAIAVTLEELGTEVIGVDSDPMIVEQHRDLVSYARQADVSNGEVLAQLGAADCSAAVVAVGEALAVSALAVASLSEIGVPRIWAKALTHQEAQLLSRVGATRVLMPEQEMGVRVGHMLRGGLTEYVAVDEQHGLATLAAPPALVGLAPSDHSAFDRLGVRVVGLRRNGGPFRLAEASATIAAGDELAVYGTPERLDALTPD